MRNGLAKMACIRGKTIVVSATRLDGRVKVEAARALDDAETSETAPEARLVHLPCGKVILSSADFALCGDNDTNCARLAHALLCCCTAVMGTEAATKGGGSSWKKDRTTSRKSI